MSCIYRKIWGQLSLVSQSQIWGTRPASPRFPSKYEYNNIVGVEQSFTVFIHGKATSRPFKLTSEMEFIYALTLFNFSRGGQVHPPPCPCLWAPKALFGFHQTNLGSGPLIPIWRASGKASGQHCSCAPEKSYVTCAHVHRHQTVSLLTLENDMVPILTVRTS